MFKANLTAADIVFMAAHMSAADRLELSCVSPQTEAEDILLEAYWRHREDPQRYVLRYLESPEGEPLLLGGWDTLTGVTWMVATDYSRKNAFRVYRAVKQSREDALKDSSRLVNMVMLTNKRHVKLLKQIKAEFVGPIVNFNNEPFQAFIIDKE